MSIARVIRATTLVAAAAGAMSTPSPGPARAAVDQQTIMEDAAQLLERGPQARERALDELKALGVDVVKVRLIWRRVAPDPTSEAKPSFDATDPAAYPPDAWARYDAVVRGVTARGMQVFLTLSSPAPEWATLPGEQRRYVGVFRIDPLEFARFAEAAGRRYDGTATGVPPVRWWSLLNEPSHPQFLQPVSEPLGGTMTPSAPHQYRRLYLAGHRGLVRAGHGADRILFGELLPIGHSRLSATNALRPLRFLREFFCLDRRYRPYRGFPARVRGCQQPFPPIPTSGLAFHGYTRPAGPRTAPQSPDDATIGQIARVERALDRIARSGRLPRGLPVYNTEFGIQTDPPDCAGFGASLARQAAYLNESEYDSYRRPRVRSYSNYLLIDSPIYTDYPAGSSKRYGGFQSGLRFGDNAFRCDRPSVRFPYGDAKQPTYDAFRTPLYVRRLGPRKAQVFGMARPRRGTAQEIAILRRRRVVRRVTTTGYFHVTVRGSARGLWQLRWRAGGQTYRSRRARALTDPHSRTF